MEFDPLTATPPDETGTDTYKRYYYQAQIAFPFCLDCACGGNVMSVIMEHFEDLVVEYRDRWHFIQIKTRNSELERWRLTDVISNDGGLRSLYRTYKAISGINASFALFLEGSIAADDPLENLVPPNVNIHNENLFRRVKKAFDFTDRECENFLGVVTVSPNQPPRAFIEDKNIRFLRHLLPNAIQQDIEHKYKLITQETLEAMRGDRLDGQLITFVTDPFELDQTARARAEAKQLTRQKLHALIGTFPIGPYPLLKRITQPDTSLPTDLELYFPLTDRAD